MSYVIKDIKFLKDCFLLMISNQNYRIDEYLYKVIFPYKNKELDEETFQLIQSFSNAFLVLKPLYKKIYSNEISQYELAKICFHKDISKKDVAIILKQLKKDQYLDEKKFIDFHQPIFEKNKGIKVFENFLNDNRISQNTIQEALNEYQENEAYVLQYMQSHIRSNTSSNKMLEYKLKNTLYQKGFSTSLIENCLHQCELNDDNENLKKDYHKFLLKYGENPHKIISKLINKGYNIEEVKKIVKGGEEYE